MWPHPELAPYTNQVAGEEGKIKPSSTQSEQTRSSRAQVSDSTHIYPAPLTE